MLDRVYLDNTQPLNSIIIEQIKLRFSPKNKFHDRKESSLTKYYLITIKLTAFLFFIKKNVLL